MYAIGSIKQNMLGRDIAMATAVRPSCIIPTASVGKEVENESIQDNSLLHPCDNSGHHILSVLAIGINRRHRERGMPRGSALATINING